jgi:NADP-dependent 3-hydroxy acid dehydrogenase YdfG
MVLGGRTDDWFNMFHVNVLGLSICTREALKNMKERDNDSGHVVHINRYAAVDYIGHSC